MKAHNLIIALMCLFALSNNGKAQTDMFFAEDISNLDILTVGNTSYLGFNYSVELNSIFRNSKIHVISPSGWTNPNELGLVYLTPTNNYAWSLHELFNGWIGESEYVFYSEDCGGYGALIQTDGTFYSLDCFNDLRSEDEVEFKTVEVKESYSRLSSTGYNLDQSRTISLDDIKRELPHVVNNLEGHEGTAISYTKLGITNIKAIQEIQETIEMQQRDIDKLKHLKQELELKWKTHQSNRTTNNIKKI